MANQHMAGDRSARVTVLGLGPMGRALAGAFLHGGQATTVWNRTAAKAEPVVARGAVQAGTVAEAVAAGPLVIVCVIDYAAVRAIVTPAADALKGRTLVNLTAGAPQDARELAAWCGERGIGYIDGAIMTPTTSIGGPDAILFYSGPEHLYRDHQPALAALMSKAFGVLRTAVTPRVLPDQITLVTANARASFAGLIAASVAAPIAGGVALLLGPDWLLRLATPVFVLGAIMGMRLPRHVDTPETDERPEKPNGHGRRWRTLPRVGPIVAEAMQANAALRAFSGFLILYLAFLLREERFEPVSPDLALGMLAAAAGAGGLAGTALGAWMKARAPRFIVLATLTFATAVTAAGAAFFGLWAALLVAFVGALGQSLGKLSMDAVVQREIGEEVRSSTFAVSETLHQLVWVLGGLAGLGMSIWADGRVALSVVAAALGLSLILLTARRAHARNDQPGQRRRRRHKRQRRTSEDSAEPASP